MMKGYTLTMCTHTCTVNVLIILNVQELFALEECHKLCAKHNIYHFFTEIKSLQYVL